MSFQSNNNNAHAATYVCEVQPPTPILCGSGSGFQDYNTTTSDNFLQGGLPMKRQSSSSSTMMVGNSSGTSYDLSGVDDSTSSSSGSHSHYTNDPYSYNTSANSVSAVAPNHQMMGSYSQQQQPQHFAVESYDTIPEYQQQQSYGGMSPVAQDAPSFGGVNMSVPPSMRLAALGRRRDEQQQQQQQEHQYDYPEQYQLQPGEQVMEDQFPYPQYQQQEQPPAPRGFAAHSNRQQSAPATDSSSKASLPFPECCYHKALVNRMEFIQPPPVTSAGGFAPNTRNNSYLRVFIGQCRFESTAPEVRWLIHYLTGVQPVKVELRGSGCFMAYVQSYEEVYAILNLKERLIFDHTGVWFAREEEQASFLRNYVKSYVSKIGKGFRLPKDMVVLHDQQLVQQKQQNQPQSQQQQQRRNGGGASRPSAQTSSRSQQHQQVIQTRNPNNNFYARH